MRTLRIYSPNSFPTNHTSVLPIVTMLYVTALKLINRIIGSLYLLTIFLQFCLSQVPTSGNHKSDLFSYEFCFCFVLCCVVLEPPCKVRSYSICLFLPDLTHLA